MKKESGRQTAKREFEALQKVLLNPEQLRVIRKLNGATFLSGFTGTTKSRRTIEAVLQGRRHDTNILHAAIQNARAELQKINTTMQEIEATLCGNVTTQ